MKTTFLLPGGLLAALALATLPRWAQAQTAPRPAPKTTATTTKTTVKTTTAPKPAVRTTTTTRTGTSARSGTATKTAPRTAPKPAPKPAPAPAPEPAPAPAPAPEPRPAPKANALAAGPFGVGTNVVNLGIGLGNRYGYGAGFLGGSSSVSPALSVSFERGIKELGPGVLGVGVFAGYQGASYDFGGGDKMNFRDIIVTVRGAFHYPVSAQFDAYGGLGIGLRHAGVSYNGSPLYSDYDGGSDNELAAGLFLGGRYFFTDALGGFAELGYDQTYLKIGLAARF